MKRILITGSNGFVGKNLIDHLRKEFDVYGIDRFQENEDEKNIICDITELGKISNIFNDVKPDIVIHLAAIVHKNNADTSEKNYNFINYECSKYLFDLCGKMKTKVIFASTIEVYGETEELYIDEMVPAKPNSYYAKSKFKAEEYLSGINVNYTILRFVPLYGKDFTLNVDKRVYIKKDKIAYYFKKGEYTFNFCSIDNVLKCIDYLCKNNFSNDTFILADKQPISSKEIISTNKRKHKIIVVKLPYSLALIGISILDMLKKSNKDSYLSKRNFKKLFLSKNYSSSKISNLIDLDSTYERTVL